MDTKQLKEKWVYQTIDPDKKMIKLEHIAINEAKIDIPKSSVGRGVRTTSNLRSINVDDFLGLLIKEKFGDYKNKFLRYILNKKAISSFSPKEFESISKRYETRKSHIHLNRRLYLASPGTSLVAFSSEEPFVSVDTWGFVDLNLEESKLLSLWLNSTFGIIQLLIVGVAIEGNWMKVHKYMQEEIFVPDPKSFIKGHIDDLNALYENVAKIQLPSLVNQFEEYNQTRKDIDEFFINKLDLETGFKSIEDFYDAVLDELRGLCPSDFE